MKIKLLTIACCATILSISTIANSAEGPYVSGNLGLAIPSDSDIDSGLKGIGLTLESDEGLAFGAAIGQEFTGNIRLEAEIAYQENDLDKAKVSVLGLGSADLEITGDTSSLALLLNGYYDFKNESAFTPFICGGVGMAKVDVSGITVTVPGWWSGPVTTSDDDTVFAYQIGAGLGYAVNEKVSLDVKYRYFGTSDPEFELATAEYSSHNVYAGIRISF